MAMFSQAGVEATRRPKGDRKLDIEAIIKKAVNAGIEAGKRQAERAPVDAYKATEKRLYALPDLKDKVERDKQYLKDLLQHGLAKHSKDIVRFKTSGQRLSDDEILEGVAKDVQAAIAADEFEIKTIEDALAPLTSDPNYLVISGRFFEGKSDEEIGKKLKCDPTTVRRNRGKLMHRIVVRLYGAGAL